MKVSGSIMNTKSKFILSIFGLTSSTVAFVLSLVTIGDVYILNTICLLSVFVYIASVTYILKLLKILDNYKIEIL